MNKDSRNKKEKKNGRKSVTLSIEYCIYIMMGVFAVHILHFMNTIRMPTHLTYSLSLPMCMHFSSQCDQEPRFFAPTYSLSSIA